MPRRMRDESAVALVEYALLVALIAVALVGAVTAFSGGLQQVFATANADFGGESTPEKWRQ